MLTLAITGDWHLTDKRPRSRKDRDYLATALQKIREILSIGPNYILQPGDFFDSFRANDYVKAEVIKLLREYASVEIITIYGQHDMRYHSDVRTNTPLRVLEEAHACYIAGSKPLRLAEGDVHVYGASWGEEIPKIVDPDMFNILLTHRMVVRKDPLWPGQTDFVRGGDLLKKHNFDLIVTGDNHQQFICGNSSRKLINCGSLMRSTVAQINHMPTYYEYRHHDKQLIQHTIPVHPIEDVMDYETAEQEKERNEHLTSFIQRLRESSKVEPGKERFNLDFKRNLFEYIKNNKIPKGAKNIIEEVLDVTR